MGGSVAADGSGSADEGVVTVGVAGWGGVMVWTGRGVAAGDGVVSDGGVAVCGGVCGGEKQLSTCGICRFLASTKSRLLARVACCRF